MSFTGESFPMEYQVVDFDGWFKWMCLRGKFYVDPLYLDEYKSEHPEAVQA